MAWGYLAFGFLRIGGPAWRPLLTIRGEPLGRVGRLLEIREETVHLQADPVGDAELRTVVHRGLGRREAGARLVSELADKLLDRRSELGAGNGAKHEAVLRRAAAVEPPRREDQLARALRTQTSWGALRRTSAGHHSELGVVIADASFVCRDREIGSQNDLESAGARQPVYRRDHGDRQRLHPQEHPIETFEKATEVTVIAEAAVEARQVHPDAEHFAASLENESADRLIGLDVRQHPI